MGRTLRLRTRWIVLWNGSSAYHHGGAIMVRFMPEDLPAHEKELTIGEYKLVGDTVWRKLGYTKSDISIPVCKIYGETDVIRERIFKTLFTDYPYGRGIMHYSPLADDTNSSFNKSTISYSPLANASVTPVFQSHPEAPEVFGYDVREGVSKDKLLGCGCYGWL